MKARELKILHLLLLFFTPTTFIYSQSWNRTGNNILNTDFIGVTNGYDFVIKTNPFNTTSIIEQMRITNDGNIGIGTATPASSWASSKLMHMKALMPELKIGNDSASFSVFSGISNNYFHSTKSLTLLLDANEDNQFTIARRNDNSVFQQTDNTPLLTLNQEGILYVRGLKVTIDSFPDYVFYPGYNMMPLNLLKEYIVKEQHLPGMPSAASVHRDGFDIGTNYMLLTKKIEELTLYVLLLKEEIDQLQQKLKNEK